MPSCEKKLNLLFVIVYLGNIFLVFLLIYSFDKYLLVPIMYQV